VCVNLLKTVISFGLPTNKKLLTVDRIIFYLLHKNKKYFLSTIINNLYTLIV